MLMENTNNKKFWDNYVSYWENKSNAANSNVDVKDKTYDDRMFSGYFATAINNMSAQGKKILGFGCGTGRLFDIISNEYPSWKSNYTGINVSSVCLEHAAKKHGVVCGEKFAYI